MVALGRSLRSLPQLPHELALIRRADVPEGGNQLKITVM